MSTFLAPHSVAPPHSTPAPAADDPGAGSASADAGSGRRRSRRGAILFGPSGQPGWARPLLWLLLAGTAALYLVDLSASGYANEFYAAAVKAGTQSVKAWLFGSLDAGNSITVDKPPVSLWPMVLSARLFGFSSFSMLFPQALMGVGTVALTHAAVKRWSGPAAGLVAGALVALTPVAALMFRFNNPDALLTLLLVAGAYCTLRAIETAGGRGGIRWLLLTGSAVGFAFLTKMGEALLVLPGFATAYLVAAPVRVPLRLRNLLIALGAVVVSAGWYVALVDLWPAADRPYIGGSTNNSLLELALGYNGISRLAGGEGNPGGGGLPGGDGGFGGTTGLLRMFNSSFRGEISWLLPVALLFLAVGLTYTWRSVRTDRTRAALLLWGGWLLVTVAVFSYMGGIIHPYYVVVLAPPIAAVVAIVGRELWRGRTNLVVRSLLATGIAGTGLWSAQLLGLTAPGWLLWLRWVVLVGSFAGAALLMISVGQFRRAAAVALLVGSLCGVGGAAEFTEATAATPHSGSIPTSGPASAGSRSGNGPGGGFGGRGRFSDGSGGFGGGAPESGPGGQAAGGAGGASTGDGPPAGGEIGSAPQAAGAAGTDAAGAGGVGGAGGAAARSGSAPGTADADSSITALLNATRSTWAAAVIGSQSAATYELSTDTAVMAIGGFSGTDQSPTLAQFQQDVAEGRITYFIARGGRDGGGGGSFDRGNSGTAAQITSWVEQNYQATTVGNTPVYPLLPATTG